MLVSVDTDSKTKSILHLMKQHIIGIYECSWYSTGRSKNDTQTKKLVGWHCFKKKSREENKNKKWLSAALERIARCIFCTTSLKKKQKRYLFVFVLTNTTTTACQ